MKPNKQGIWSGMIGGTAMQTIILLWVTFRTDWNAEASSIYELTTLDACAALILKVVENPEFTYMPFKHVMSQYKCQTLQYIYYK